MTVDVADQGNNARVLAEQTRQRQAEIEKAQRAIDDARRQREQLERQ
ncbi:hypothetical protein [Actinacidiphila glaucinigra]